MVRIENKKELLGNAYCPVNRKARKIALDVIEKVLETVDPKRVIKSRVILTGNILRVNEEAFDLTAFRRIFVVGGGKASGSMAEALEEILQERIEDGLIVVPKGTAGRCKVDRIRFHEASHPIPDESSVTGAIRILDQVDRAKDNDLVICLFSGGGSSLMALPRNGISLTDKQKVTDMMLKSGATINEINIVRKHISGFKGGQVARKAYPATVLSLLLSDVLGDPLDVIASGPTVPDSTTFDDAISVLETYNLWEGTPESVRNILTAGAKGLIEENPKREDPVFQKVHNKVIGNNHLACTVAINKLRRLGLNTMLLTSFMEGEAREVGLMVGALAKEVVTYGHPLPPPVAIVAGGETTVTVRGRGIGGRNQEVALGAALMIAGLERTVVASVSTDGIDGPTDAAGAIIDGKTIDRGQRLNLKAAQYLKNNDSYSFFSKIGDLIRTGPTGTNVNDITLLLVI